MLCNIRKGFTPSTGNSSYWGGDINWLSIADMNQGKYISSTNKKITEAGAKNRNIIKKGTLLMSFKLTIGKLGILNKDMYTNEAICNFQWNTPNISTEFMYYYLSSINIKKYGSQAAKGITLNNDTLNAIPVFYPSFDEQEKIANFLSVVDKKIELMEKKCKLLENYKNGVMNLIFRKKVFFEDSNSWKLKKIKEIGTISTGNTPSTKNKEFYHPEIYLWVTPSDITKSKYINNTARKLSIEGSKKGKFVEKNSVLVTCIASIGKNCIIPVNGYFNQQINSITPNKENNSDFIYYLISFNAEKMKQYAGLTATPILNKKDFENMYFEFPPLKEQNKIADFLSKIDNKIDSIEQQLEKTKEFKKYLLQQMFV